jgi:Cu/Ag efflux pump CusA
VGSLFEQQKVFDVVVWGTPEIRNSLSSVRDLLIDTPDGGTVPLGKVADISIQPTPTVIRHQDLSRSLDVTAGVQGRDADAVAADVQQRLQGISFPLEYHAEMVGDLGPRESAHLRAIAVAIAAAIGIFLLLQAAFGSWRLAAVAFVVLPGVLVGGALAVVATGGVVSLGSLVGFLAVFAIGVRTEMQMIRHFQYLERVDGSGRNATLVQRGAHDRIVPIITTVVAAALVLGPLALAGAAAGQELVQPMAVVVLGGLVTSALVALFVIPSLYVRFAPAAPAAQTAADEVVVVPDVDQVTGA